MIKKSDIVILFFLVQPVVSSMTGLGIKYGLPINIGPLFYAFLMLLVIIDMPRRSLRLFVPVLGLFVLHFFLQLIINDTVWGDVESYIKILLGFFLFSYFRGADISVSGFNKIVKGVSWAFYIYAILTIISFAVGYQIKPGRGYYGFVYAANELMLVLLFAVVVFLFLFQYGYRFNFIYIFSAYFLTMSKSAFIILPAFASIVYRKHFFLLVVMLFVSVVAGFYVADFYWDNYFSKYLQDLEFSLVQLRLDSELMRQITYGRVVYFLDALDGGAFSVENLLLGNGVQGAMSVVFGKDGLEMDFFDALNAYGVLGVSYLVLFFYLPVFRNDYVGLSTKIAFSFIILYSFFAGHFYASPMVGFFYGIFLGLISNRSLMSELRKKQLALNAFQVFPVKIRWAK